MKKIKILIKIISMMLVLVFSLAACGSKGPPTIADIQKKGKLYMATEPGFRPYEFVENGEVVGADVELGKYIAEQLGVELEIITMDFNALIPSINSGKANLAIAGMSRDKDREITATLSNTYYFDGGQIILSRVEDNYQTLEELKDKVVGAQQGTIGDIIMTDNLNDAKDRKTYKQYAQAVSELSNGVLDAIVMDEIVALQFMNEFSGLTTSELIEKDEMVIVMAKGKSTDFVDLVNSSIDDLVEQGKINEWVEKYSIEE